MLNKIKDIEERLKILPEKKQKQVLILFYNTLQAAELEQQLLIDICQKEGHIYDCWHDCSYSISPSNYKRSVDSLTRYMQNTLTSDIHIRWTRRCVRCDYIQLLKGKIPETIIESNNKKKHK